MNKREILTNLVDEYLGGEGSSFNPGTIDGNYPGEPEKDLADDFIGWIYRAKIDV